MKIGIRGKLLAGFGIVLCLMLVVGLAGWWSTASLSGDLDEAEERLRGTVALANAESALWRLRYGFPQFLVLGPEEQAEILADEPKHYQTIHSSIERYEAGKLTPEERVALREFKDIFAKYIGARPRWFQLQTEGREEEAVEWRAATTTPFGAGAVAGLKRLIELSRESSAKARLMDSAESHIPPPGKNACDISLTGLGWARYGRAGEGTHVQP